MSSNLNSKINLINNIKFTSREIDVIACSLYIKGAKKISQILNISPRTVEGHISNILQKISGNFQEDIKEFVEKSETFKYIQQHYINLNIRHVFENQIIEIAEKLRYRDLKLIVHYTENKKLDFIIEYLQKATIQISKIDALSKKATLVGYPTLTILNKDHIVKLREEKNYYNVIFLCLDEQLRSQYLKDFSKITIIDCFDSDDSLYSAVFKILEFLDSSDVVKKALTKFHNVKNDVIHLKIEANDLKQKNDRKFATKLISLIIVTLLLIGLYNFYLKENAATIINSNLKFLSEDVILPRKDLVKNISDILNTKQNDIEVATLVGIGGAGKSTLARSYAKSSNTSINWELNAESKNSLMLSFESLAYALCENRDSREELDKILKHKDIERKNNELLLFVQTKLFHIKNWLLIFDNVKFLKDIIQYFPNNKNSWGKGQVIITTRNKNILDHNLLNKSGIIEIGTLNENEKLQLFSKIYKLIITNQITTEEFLSKIPSFPLDVSIAAHYLNNSSMSYMEYLKKIYAPTSDFNKMQAYILSEKAEYTKTRYMIVATCIRKILEENREFVKLLMVTSILDSQNIPKKLLTKFLSENDVEKFILMLKQNSFTTNMEYENISNSEYISTYSLHRIVQENIRNEMSNILSQEDKESIMQDIAKKIEEYVLQLVDIEYLNGLKNIFQHIEHMIDNYNGEYNANYIPIFANYRGAIHYYLGREKQAKDILEYNIRKNVHEPNSMAFALTHLGAIYRKIGQDYVQSIKYLEEAISLYEAIESENAKLQKALALTHIGNTYRTIGNLQKAKESLSKANEIYELNNKSKVCEARAKTYLGVVYRELGEFSKAERLLQNAINIYNTNKYTRYSSIYAGSHAHLGATYRIMGKYEEAKDKLIESIDIYEKIRPKNHPDTGRSIRDLGAVYLELNEIEKAKDLLDLSLVNYGQTYGKDHIEAAKVLNHLGRFYIKTQDLDSAKDFVNRAFNILNRAEHTDRYISLKLFGDIEYEHSKLTNNEIEKGKYKQLAKKYYEAAYKISIEIFGIESENSKTIKKILIKTR